MAFPETHRSVVLAVQSADADERSRALEALVRACWRPVFRYLRTKWRADDERAEDLAQGFFAAALEKGWLARFDPAKGRFRTFLLSCLDAYAANDQRAERRLKRGGGTTTVPLEVEDEDGAVREIPVADRTDLEADFHREWARSIFALAVEARRRRCRGTPKEVAFALFKRYDLEGPDGPERPSYAELARAGGRRGLLPRRGGRLRLSRGSLAEAAPLRGPLPDGGPARGRVHRDAPAPAPRLPGLGDLKDRHARVRIGSKHQGGRRR